MFEIQIEWCIRFNSHESNTWPKQNKTKKAAAEFALVKEKQLPSTEK